MTDENGHQNFTEQVYRYNISEGSINVFIESTPRSSRGSIPPSHRHRSLMIFISLAYTVVIYNTSLVSSLTDSQKKEKEYPYISHYLYDLGGNALQPLKRLQTRHIPRGRFFGPAFRPNTPPVKHPAANVFLISCLARYVSTTHSKPL